MPRACAQDAPAGAGAAAANDARIVEIFSYGGDRPVKLGLGFFIDGAGLLLTTLSNVAGHGAVYVRTAGGEAFVDKMRGFDEKHNLIALQVPTHGPALELGDSDTVKAGAAVTLGGQPGAGSTISAIRDRQGQLLFEIAAPVAPGGSGAPLLNDRGQAVGVVVASVEGPQNSAYAIPVNYARPMMEGKTLQLLSDATPAAASAPEEGVPVGEFNGAKILGLLGHSIAEPDVRVALSRLSGGAAPSPTVKAVPAGDLPGQIRSQGEAQTFNFPELGLQVFAVDGRISQVRFFGNQPFRSSAVYLPGDIKSFAGSLPLGLHWGDSREDARRRLGVKPPPSHRGKTPPVDIGDIARNAGYAYWAIYSDTQQLACLSVSEAR
jgi:hypothetical protein